MYKVNTLIFGLLFLVMGNAFGQISGLPGTTRQVKEYRNSSAATAGGGTNVNVGLTRAISTFLPVNETNSTTVVTPTTVTFTTNFVATVNGAIDLPPDASLSIPFNFGDIATGLTIQSVTVQTVINGVAANAVTQQIQPPGAALIDLFVPSTAVITISSSNINADITFVPTATTPACQGTGFRSSFTTNIVSTLAPCAGALTYDGVQGDPIAGEWNLVFKNNSRTVVGGSGTAISFDQELRSMSITVTAVEGRAITFGGKTFDLRPRSTRAQDFSVIDPNTGATVTRTSRSVSER